MWPRFRRRLHEHGVEGTERHRAAPRRDQRAGMPGRRAARVHPRQRAVVRAELHGRADHHRQLRAIQHPDHARRGGCVERGRDGAGAVRHPGRSTARAALPTLARVAEDGRDHRHRPADRAARRSTYRFRWCTPSARRPIRATPRWSWTITAERARPCNTCSRSAGNGSRTSPDPRAIRVRGTAPRRPSSLPATRWSVSRCTASGPNGGDGMRSTFCCVRRLTSTRDLLRQRSDRPRGLRSPPRAGPRRSRRHRGHRVRQLVGDGAGQPAAADHCRSGVRGTGPPNANLLLDAIAGSAHPG